MGQELPRAILALSARVSVIECAVAALAPKDEYERQKARANFKHLGGELLDRNIGLPVDEEYIELLRQSLDDFAAMLGCDEIR